MDPSSPASPAATAPTGRAAHQAHLDGRLARLRAYEAALTQELAAGPRAARRVQLDGQLTQVRRALRFAAPPRLASTDSRGARAVRLGVRTAAPAPLR